MTTLAFGPWEPDKGPLDPNVIDTVNNLNPLANGWGPFPDLQEVGSSIGATCLGCWYARKSDGSFSLYAGTATKLYQFDTATQTWTDRTGGTAPNVPSGQFHQALQFGTKFIVVSLGMAPQVVDVDAGGSFADLGGSPPQAKYIWAAGDFVVLGYLKVGATEYPQRVHWSALNNAADWTISRLTGCDRQDLPDGDEITGGFGFPGGARIIQHRAKRAMIFTGGQFVFEFRVLDATKGSGSPYSIVPISSNDYVFWRDDGIFRGDENIPIGAERTDSFLFDKLGGDADSDFLDTVQGIADPFDKVVMWCYRSSSGVQKIIAWDWELDRWFPLGTAAVLLFSAVTPGYTLEALDAVSASLDALTPSLDSRVWKGGAPTLGVFTSTNTLAYFAGSAMAGTIETNTVELNDGMRSFVNGAKVKGNPGSGSTIEAGVAMLPDDTVTYKTAVSRSSRTGAYSVRADGFFHRFRLNTAAGDTSFTHVHGISVDVQPSGEA